VVRKIVTGFFIAPLSKNQQAIAQVDFCYFTKDAMFEIDGSEQIRACEQHFCLAQKENTGLVEGKVQAS